MRNISGTITAIKGATFTLHNEMSGFSNPSLSERIVSVTTKTEISKITQKDEKALQAEMADFIKKVDATKTKPQLVLSPELSVSSVASVSDITIGSSVQVVTIENIATKKNLQQAKLLYYP